MLEKLSIKNYLIIKDAELHFSKGLNILTGETGAGKSIILDALSLILGERADYSIIKKDDDKLVVEGEFSIAGNKKIKRYIKDKDVISDSYEDILIIRRELYKKGISRNFINDSPVSIGDLKELGDLIIDIHSQNEHQSLIRKSIHIEILDSFAGNEKIFNEFRESYENFKNEIKTYKDLVSKKDALTEKKGYIEFQLKEINNVNPSEGEDEQLKNELNKLENTEDITVGVNNALNLLSEAESNIISSLSASVKELTKISKYDSELEKVLEELNTSFITIKDAVQVLNGYRDTINFDNNRIEEIRTRLSSLNFLKKKYKMSVAKLIERATELEKELNFAENYDYEIEKMYKGIEKNKEELYKKSILLSETRKKAVKELEKRVNSYLKETGLESAEFKVDNKKYEKDGDSYYTVKNKNNNEYISSNGLDDVEFLIKTNKSAEFTPLKKTASGGEISRIMLSVKASLSGRDDIPVLVFDEIDAGISGRIARKVGKLLKQLSSTHQIISITHLPQIAAMSDTHFRVSKQDGKSETVATIDNISGEEKVAEIAKLISGEKVTETSLKTARELIEQN